MVIPMREESSEFLPSALDSRIRRQVKTFSNQVRYLVRYDLMGPVESKPITKADSVAFIHEATRPRPSIEPLDIRLSKILGRKYRHVHPPEIIEAAHRLGQSLPANGQNLEDLSAIVGYLLNNAV